MQAREIVFTLIRSAVCGYEADANTVSEMREALKSEELLQAIAAASVKHDLAHIVGYSLEKYGLLEGHDAYAQKFAKKQFSAVYRYEKLNYELSVLTQALEEGGIDHIPLKGSVLRDKYPEPWMRTSCDIDVLLHNRDIKKAKQYLGDKLGYVHTTGTAHDISMYSAGGVHVELHYELVEEGLVNSATRVLDHAWKHAHRADGKKHSYQFSDEMFYFYHISHMAKHFVKGGCGIRPFIDLWILNRDASNANARKKLLVSGDLWDFTEAACELCGVWFEGNEHTARSKAMEEYVLNGGIYGNWENATKIKQRKAGSKLVYVLKRIFEPYEELRHYHPRLCKYKWMLPICWFVRCFLVLDRKRTRRIAHEINVTKQMSKESISETDRFLSDIGLK